VPVDVHTLVQDAHVVDDVFGGHPVEQRVRPGGKLAIAEANLVAGSADLRVCRSAVDGVLKFARVLLGLSDSYS
jgi:hypothetical protein